MRVSRWWNKLSVAKKLYSIVGVMATLIALELFTLLFAMNILSAVRALVGGEGLWSKAQKDAVYNLERFASTRDPQFYQRFEEELKVPFGDHQARLAMEKQDLDWQDVTDGFVKGGNHPSDVESMVKLIRRFYWVPQMARALERWQAGDVLIFRLVDTAQKLKRQIEDRKSSSTEIQATLNEIANLNIEFTKVENGFSSTLGEASRWLENVLMAILLLAVATVELTGLILTISFTRRLQKSLIELNSTAESVGRGDFEKKVKVHSTDELGHLSTSLNRMIENLKVQILERKNAEHASQAKNLFLANMSHEIRTPLNSVLGFAELLAEKDLDESERRQYLEIVKRTGANLTTIINDILDIAKVEAEQLEVERKSFSLKQLLNDIELLLSLKCQEKGVRLIFQPSGKIEDSIWSDPVRLRQILLNMIGNSIKFTEHGEVRIDYRVERTGLKQDLVFDISDTGVGIPYEQVPNLFRPFAQGDHSTRKKFAGTGLGLIIAKRLAYLLEGDVVLVRSEVGRGSLFQIRVLFEPSQPTSTSPENLKSAASANSPSFSNLNFLVVDDTFDNQILVKHFLGKNGAKVDFASNGLEGVERVLQGSYDLVIMDMQMPVMDGYAAVERIRKMGYKIPIIALTGYAMKKDRERCLEAGCTDYLAKPVDRAQLVSTISRYVTQ